MGKSSGQCRIINIIITEMARVSRTSIDLELSDLCHKANMPFREVVKRMQFFPEDIATITKSKRGETVIFHIEMHIEPDKVRP